MNKLIERSELRDIYEKVEAAQRVNEDDCLRLYHSHDLAAIGAMANVVRERKNGNAAYYILNRHINYSNICILDCDFCAFYRRRRDAGAYEYNLPQMIEKAQEALKLGITEIHIVGGLHPSFKWEYYVDMLRSLKALDPNLHLKAFTAIEILHLSWVGKRNVPETLAALREAGLGSLTGGGAEIFDPEVRSVICHAKESAEEWIDVHRLWHKMGGRSTCTMLIGHVEKEHHRVDHLRRLRQLQDETHGFTAFVTLAFHPDNTKLPDLTGPSGYDMLKTLAIARIYLDNIDHIKAYWVLMGMKLAQVSLSYGVDDLDGTVMEEKIYHMAGAKTPQEMAREELVKAIRETGREPVQRDSLYRPLKSVGAEHGAPVSSQAEASGVSVLSTEAAYAGASNEGGGGVSVALPWRIGCVPYLNARPLIYGIEDQVTLSPPSRLADLMYRGQFDAGLVPIAEVIQHDRYDVLDGIAIATRGRIQSVYLVHREPIEKLKRVAVDTASRTSAWLVRIILQYGYNVSPEFYPRPEGGKLSEHEAMMLIGDEALWYRTRNGSQPILDLGEAWVEMTGLPFVFAAWALQRGLDGKAIGGVLRAARVQGIANIERIVQDATEATPEIRREYLTKNLSYELDVAEKRGVRRFQQYLKEMRLVDGCHDLRYVA